MKIALLGANGFVGTNVLTSLSNKGYDVTGISRKSGYDLRELTENLRFLKEVKPDVIINCAAHVGSLNYVTEFAADVLTDNSKMILHLYESVSVTNPGIIIIHPLANCAYPAQASIYKEEEFWNGPLHPSVMAYGFTRRTMWSTAEAYSKQHGVRSINLITPNMYGPHDSTDPNKAHALNALISKFVKAVQEQKEQVEIWGTGAAVREWLYAPDFARIVLEILQDLENEKYKVPFNIAQESGLSVKELVNLILEKVPYKGNVWYNTARPDGAPRKVMSKAHFEKVFPHFTFTPFSTGIKETIQYYNSVYPY